MSRSIIIMAKVPRAGNVKTRLQPFFSPDESRSLAEAFLFDAMDKAHPLCDCLLIAFTPDAEKEYFNNFGLSNLTLVRQRGADLGEKMSNAFEFAFESDSKAAVIMIGTDSPTFPPSFIERAFELLEAGSEAVLGKSADGGFYLIGLRKPVPRLFDDIEWSSPQVFKQITRNLQKLKSDPDFIPGWYDVDTPEDFRRLRDELFTDENAGEIAPHTYKWLLTNSIS